jgi:copper chaperone CopZ
MKKIFLSIEGMSCGHCVRTAKNTLLDVEGVKEADVNLNPGSASVLCEDTVTGEQLLTALKENTDYTASVSSESLV